VERNNKDIFYSPGLAEGEVLRMFWVVRGKDWGLLAESPSCERKTRVTNEKVECAASHA